MRGRPLLVVEQVEHALHLRRKAPEHRAHCLLPLPHQNDVEGRIGRAYGVQIQQSIQFVVVCSHAPRLADRHILRTVPCNGVKPGRKLCRLLQSRKPLQRADKRILCHIFGRLLGAYDLARDHRGRAAKPPYQLIACFQLAELRQLSNGGIVQFTQPAV